jgi:hypothetical protein
MQTSLLPYADSHIIMTVWSDKFLRSYFSFCKSSYILMGLQGIFVEKCRKGEAGLYNATKTLAFSSYFRKMRVKNLYW